MNLERFRRGLIYLLVFIAIFFIIWGVRDRGERPDVLPLNEVAIAASDGRIEKIVVTGNELLITFTDGEKATSTKDRASSAPEQLAALGVSAERLIAIEWEIREPREWETWLAALTYILPLVFVAVVIYMLLRQAQRQGPKT